MGSRSTGGELAELAFIALGSNIGPERHLPRALERLSRIGQLVGVSNAYRNPAIGGDPQPDFINAAALLEFDGTSEELRSRLREIEAELGRVRTDDKYAPRTIDLDLVWLDDRVEHRPPLPDPEITERAHLAVPLAELDPAREHPATGERLEQIADRLGSLAGLELHAEVSEQLRAIVAQSKVDPPHE